MASGQNYIVLIERSAQEIGKKPDSEYPIKKVLNRPHLSLILNLGLDLASASRILVLACFLAACGAKESITPTWQPTPIDDQLKQRPLQVSIPIDDLEVEEFGADFGEIDELGPLFRELAGVFANVALDEEGGQRYEIDPVIYFAPELDQVEDWSILDNLNIKNINLVVSEAEDYELANFEFIKELRIYIDFAVPGINQMDRQGGGVLVASYDRELDRENLGCLGRCLELKVADVNWKEIVKTQRTFVIYTELVVESVPQTKMKIGGSLGLSVGLQLGL